MEIRVFNWLIRISVSKNYASVKDVEFLGDETGYRIVFLTYRQAIPFLKNLQNKGFSAETVQNDGRIPAIKALREDIKDYYGAPLGLKVCKEYVERFFHYFG